MKFLLGAIAALLVGGLVLVLEPFLGDVSIGQSSTSHLPSGFRAVRELAEVDGHSPRVWRGTTEQLSGTGGALLILNPLDQLFSQQKYLSDLQTWVEAGNTVLVSPRRFETQVVKALGRQVEQRLAAPQSNTGLFSWLETLGLVEQETLYTRANQAAQLDFSDGTSLAVHLEAELPSAAAEYSDQWQLLAEVDGRPLAFSRPLGEGKLVYWRSASLFDNWSLGRNGNAAAAMHVLDLLEADELLFDEFFHGLPAVGGFRDLLFSARVWPVTVIGLILFTLVLWSARVRTLSLQPEPLPSRRSKEEHLRAMGDLLCNGREGAWVAEQLLVGVRAALVEELGLPPQANDAEIAQRLAMRDAERARVFSSSAQQVAELPSAGRDGLQERELVRWANLLMTVLPERIARQLPASVTSQTPLDTNS